MNLSPFRWNNFLPILLWYVKSTCPINIVWSPIGISFSTLHSRYERQSFILTPSIDSASSFSNPECLNLSACLPDICPQKTIFSFISNGMTLTTNAPDFLSSSIVWWSFRTAIAYIGGLIDAGMCQSRTSMLSLISVFPIIVVSALVVTAIVSLGFMVSNINFSLFLFSQNPSLFFLLSLYCF